MSTDERAALIVLAELATVGGLIIALLVFFQVSLTFVIAFLLGGFATGLQNLYLARRWPWPRP